MMVRSLLTCTPARTVTSGGTRAASDLVARTAGTGGTGRNADWASLDWAQRRGRALTDLIEHLDTDKLTGKVASTVIVTMTLEQALAAAKTALLQAEVNAATGTLIEMAPSSGAASTDTGTPISASAARRIACNAGILPAILGGPSQILDLGRQERFFTDHQRTALATTYETCAADDCDRPYAWSELHHENPWSRADSPTSTERSRSAATTTDASTTPAISTRSGQTPTPQGRRPSTSDSARDHRG
jgi:hypothetical protein